MSRWKCEYCGDNLGKSGVFNNSCDWGLIPLCDKCSLERHVKTKKQANQQSPIAMDEPLDIEDEPA